MRHTTRSAALAVAFALLLTPALAGCIGNPVEQIVEGAVEQAGGGDVDLNSDGGLPDGFPTEVPLYDGEIVGGMGVGVAEGDGGWTVIVKVADPEASFTSINDQLVAAGFESQFSGFSDGSGTGMYQGANYGVLVTVADDGSGQVTATYIVSANSAE
ncbi:hypothetical protein SCB71_12140 [Herbiconiux sp. KACC 21604]|uniref:hypothetical protein n=1 Tax=unclassified Herbiconiux TaxID=2618217 RepID=UPI001491DECF|nr:hypothetical protein [Herbiconiux sp. SALV-R1]QJU53939.1 hypothetical protein HL652_10090 [Herbiconiux sp. SALV-R1]WPO84966.1 hypothetical protein SCB71_12140 [Herbiconiux sp. KACC 21604]